MVTGGRILDLAPSQEEAVVARVLVLVHQAVDEHFPSAEKASRQFTKTVFSEESNEKTAIGRTPDEVFTGLEQRDAFGANETTSPGGQPDSAEAAAEGGAARPGPPPFDPQRATAAAAPSAPPPWSVPPKIATDSQPLVTLGSASLDSTLPASTTTSESSKSARYDWQMILTLALLVAGLILLAYALLS